MKLNFSTIEKSFIFKLVILLDRTFNVLTGGTFQECFSTRTYINSETATPLYNRDFWVKIKNAINWVFWDGHCKDSFEWELNLKRLYIAKNSHLSDK